MKKNTISQFATFLFVLMSFVCTSAAAQNASMQLFPLRQVKLLPSDFFNAEQTDLRYMLTLKPDRLLAPFLRESGLQPKAESYGNWENTGLDGHTAGHYLTALAQMYAATGNSDCKARMDYMVSELARCQASNENGYVGGVPGGMAMWAQLKNGDFASFNKKWVPWYNLHKLFAGLRDCYLLAGSQQAKTVLIKLADWTLEETKGLSEMQMQKILNTEFGGMNEVLADVGAITGDDKYVKLAERFNHLVILDQLEKHEDRLNGLHANTQIPKVIGFERISELDHNSGYADAARFFWGTVVNNRSVSIGGNSFREHFNPANDFTPMLESEEGPETCNSNNMLKLTKMLFLQDGAPEYVNFYERVLYNHILSSQHPDSGGFVYFTPIRPQHYRVYSSSQQDFWCCVGTGMENHGKYGELIYTHSNNDLYVNLFIPSKLNWPERGMQVAQVNNFPDEAATQLKLTLKQPSQFTMFIRKPSWLVGDSLAVNINGKAFRTAKAAKGYVGISRTWKNGDVVKILLPMKNYVEYLPDHSEWASFLHGPIVLAAVTDTTDLQGLKGDGSRWGHIARGKLYDFSSAPLVADNGRGLARGMLPVKNESLVFQMPSLIYQPAFQKLKLVPFYRLHDARYVIYFPVAKADSIKGREDQLAAEDSRVARLTANIIDQVRPGEQQPEADHGINSADSNTGIFQNRHWRDAGDYFSYKLQRNLAAATLQISYSGKIADTEFDVYVNQINVAHIVAMSGGKEAFLTKDIPLAAIKPGDSKTVEVKFVAAKDKRTAQIFEVKLSQNK